MRGKLLAMLVGAPVSLYVVPHQDDEILTLGSAVLTEAAAGRHVVAMIISRGEGSNIRTGSTLNTRLGYTPGVEEFSEARDREFVEAVKRMGATPFVLPYSLRLADGSAVASTIADMIKLYFPEDVALRATSRHDYHADHRACGMALEILGAEGFGTDHRQFISQYQLSLWPVGVQQNRYIHRVTTEHTWSYTEVDVPNGWWGLGNLSVPAWFTAVHSNSSTYWHSLLGL